MPPTVKSEIRFFAVMVFLLIATVFASAVSAQTSRASGLAPSIEWQQQYGDRSIESVSNVLQTSEGGYAFIDLGWSHQATLRPSTIYNVNSLGNLTWQRTISHFKASAFAQTNDGGYEIWGNWDTYGTTYQKTPAVVKMDGGGNIQWTRNFTIANAESHHNPHLLMLNDGGFIVQYQVNGERQQNVTSIVLVKTNSSGLTDWNQTYTFRGNRTNVVSITQTKDGGYLLLGSTSLQDGKDTANTYYLLAKTDSEGNLQFNHQYGNGPLTLNTNSTENQGAQKSYNTYGRNLQVFGDNEPNSVTETDDGFIIAGIAYPEGHYTIAESFAKAETYLVKTDSNGIEQWNRLFAGADNSPVIQTSDKGYAFAIPGSIVKIDQNGQTQWIKNITYAYSEYPGSVFSLRISHLLEASDGSLVGIGTGSGASPSYLGYIYLVKTEPFLPSPTPAPSLPPPLATENVNAPVSILTAIVGAVAASVIVVLAVIVILWKRRSKQYASP